VLLLLWLQRKHAPELKPEALTIFVDMTLSVNLSCHFEAETDDLG
jgi:hypothetical protein